MGLYYIYKLQPSGDLVSVGQENAATKKKAFEEYLRGAYYSLHKTKQIHVVLTHSELYKGKLRPTDFKL